MMNSVTQDIADLLVAAGLGTLGTNLFHPAFGPDDLDVQTMIGSSGGMDAIPSLSYEQPNFQVMCRGEREGDAMDVYTTIRTIFEYLNNKDRDGEVINGTTYLGFHPKGNVASLGMDEHKRYVYTMNFYTFRNPA